VLVARGQGDSEQVKMSLRLKRYGLVDRESRSHAATTDGGRLPRYVHAVSGATVLPDVSRPRGSQLGAEVPLVLQARAPKVDLNFNRSLKMLPCVPRNGALFSQHRTFSAPELSLKASRKDIQCWALTQRLTKSLGGHVSATLVQQSDL
jgi:hypothetical protein